MLPPEFYTAIASAMLAFGEAFASEEERNLEFSRRNPEILQRARRGALAAQDVKELRDLVRRRMMRDEETARGYMEEIGRAFGELKGGSFLGMGVAYCGDEI
jgi:hypothetical protein